MSCGKLMNLNAALEKFLVVKTCDILKMFTI